CRRRTSGRARRSPPTRTWCATPTSASRRAGSPRAPSWAPCCACRSTRPRGPRATAAARFTPSPTAPGRRARSPSTTGRRSTARRWRARGRCAGPARGAGSLGPGAKVTTSGLTVGLPTVTAAVPASGGLGGQPQTSIRVRAPNTPPAVPIASPADGSSVPAGTAVRLGAAASDDFDGDLTGQIRWTSSRDGALGPNGTRLLSEGAHTLVAAVTDSDGAPGSATARLTVTPTPPVVTIAAPADGTTIFAGTSLAFSGTATDATDGDLSAALRWLSDRDGQIGSGPS